MSEVLTGGGIFAWVVVTLVTALNLLFDSGRFTGPEKAAWIAFWPLLGPAVGLLGIVEMWQVHSAKKRARLEAEYRRAVKELEVER